MTDRTITLSAGTILLLSVLTGMLTASAYAVARSIDRASNIYLCLEAAKVGADAPLCASILTKEARND